VQAGRIKPRERAATFDPGLQPSPTVPPVGLEAL
jgi:hypothetical protein